MRWQHPDRGLIGPNEFIPVAEETGLIVPLGRWVLSAAVRQLVEWDRDDVYVAVNLSGRQLVDGSLVEDVAGLLDRYAIQPGQLCLEITETALVSDMPRALKALTGLKALGVRLALDDFGQGQSSLANLRRFPVDVIKVDRTFVGTIDEDARIVAAIIELGRALGLAVVGEGVETPEQALQLQALGCRLGQGYLFGAAVPAYRLLGQFLHPQGVVTPAAMFGGALVSVVPGPPMPDDDVADPHPAAS